MDHQQIDLAVVSDLRKMVNHVKQHHNLQLVDTVPSLMELLNLNSVDLNSLNTKSLIQIGYYVLEETNIYHKHKNEFISRLVSKLLNSSVNDDKERRAMQSTFLLSVWYKKDIISLPLHLQERIINNWKHYLQEIILALVIKCHGFHDSQNQQHFTELFATPDIIFFLNICRHSPIVFQTAIMTFTTFLILKKGCSIISSLMKEFVTLVEIHSKTGLSTLFPPKYKALISYLQLNPDSSSSFSYCDVKDIKMKSDIDFDQKNVLELLVTTFKEDKYSGIALLGCFPIWLDYLAKYYSQNYNKSFFTDFYF